MRCGWPSRRVVPGILLLFLVTGASPLAAEEIGLVEDFALAPDRTVPLAQLIPGTDESYYYHALHYLNTEQFAQAEKLLGPWFQRHQRTPRYVEIETRLMLLTYSQDPQRTLQFLRRRLGVEFQQPQGLPGRKSGLPSALPPRLIDRATLLQRAFEQQPSLELLEPSAWEWLSTVELTPARRREFLRKLTRPDYPQLVEWLVEDQGVEPAPSFGDYPVHRQLLRSQLDELLQRRPELRQHGALVETYLQRLSPAPDDDWRHDHRLLAAYLERLDSFVSTLGPRHHSLRAHVLYHRLQLDRARGQFDQARLLAYLALPRPLPYVAPRLLAGIAGGPEQVAVDADFTPWTGLPSIGNDEPLVREYVAHFLRDAPHPRAFAPYLQESYLQRLFAETKIVHGSGDPEAWAAQLTPEEFEALQQRVDIDFAPTNPTTFAPDQPVQLDLFLKNVPTLIVKVYEIQAGAYYRQHLREVDTDIPLDGLVANEERTHQYSEPPLLRVARRFEFPQLRRPGLYVVDFIGHGQSSRALIRKGRLRHAVRTTPAGQEFTVFDDSDRPAPDATLWLAGHLYSADRSGRILVPFAAQPGRQSIVLERGDVATLDQFQQEGEEYALQAGMMVDREALLARRTADLLIRPALLLNQTRIAPRLLQDAQLEIVATRLDGVATLQSFPQVPLLDDRETVQRFQVPDRLATLTCTLRGHVVSVRTGQPVPLSVSETFHLNEIDRTERIDDVHLLPIRDHWALEVRGRTGEPRPERRLEVALKHRDFKEPVRISLQTDARGRVALGPLPDIVSVTVTGPESTPRTWPLPQDQHRFPRAVHGLAGTTLSLPYLGTAKAPTRAEFSLLELRGEAFVADHFDRLGIKDGLLELRQMPAGDYDLWLKKSDERLRVRIVPGVAGGGYLLGQQRVLAAPPLAPPQISSLETAGDQLVIRLRNATTLTRVHLFATRFEPAYSAFAQLSQVSLPGWPVFSPGRADSAYLVGRQIGDEYRYILDRRHARKFPGNTLPRPALLLNPWATRSTATERQDERDEEEWLAQQQRSESRTVQDPAAVAPETGLRDFANLDFLAQAALVRANLAPDPEGVIRLPLSALGPQQRLAVVAVDPLHTTCRHFILPETPLEVLDLRLAKGLDPQQHFVRQSQITVLAPGGQLSIADVTNSRVEVYDDLARVYRLYQTLSTDAHLGEFRFLLDWPQLSAEEKRSRYSRLACHELHLFLARKDPEFFREVIRPYLANKRDRTFLDRWLLGESLERYRDPWEYGRLNVAEQALLGRQLDKERPFTARHLREQWECQPRDRERFRQLYETAVQGSVLATRDSSRRGVLADAEPLADRPALLGNASDDAYGGIAGSGAADDRATKLRIDVANRSANGTAAAPSRSGVAERDGKTRGTLEKRNRAEEAEVTEAYDVELRQKELSRWDTSGGERHGQPANAERWFDDGETRFGTSVRQLYRQVELTQEWAESNYFRLPVNSATADLATVNAFWRDLAAHAPNLPFVSSQLIEPTRGGREMLMALALLDLPFVAGKHQIRIEGVTMTLQAASPAIVFHEEIRPAAGAEAATPLLVTQNYFRHGARHREENGESVDNFVVGEFLTHIAYGCEVVVTNPTSTRQKLTVLTQIPRGAMPLLNTRPTDVHLIDLEPYRTQALTYHFYWPMAGDFPHFPAHVARDDQFVVAARPATHHVVATPTQPDETSWEYVSQHGSDKAVLDFLRQSSLNSLDLERLAFRLHSIDFFDRLTQLLSERHFFAPTIWSYSLLHNRPRRIHEYLLHQEELVKECGGCLRCELLEIDPVARQTYEHLEYRPLVNARAHTLGPRRQIVNARFAEQYARFLQQLSYIQQLSDDDWLEVTYYLLLQDRVAEALESFRRVRAEQISTRIQYDYLAAYLMFYQEEPQRAQAIARPYADHPVDRWRLAFRSLLAQVDELQGRDSPVVDPLHRDQQQAQLAASEPSLELVADGPALTLRYERLASVRVNYYPMDAELLFSRQPFVQQNGPQVPTIRPHQTETIMLAGEVGERTLALPEPLRTRNVMVEVTGAGVTRALPIYAHQLAVQLVESEGQLRVRHATSAKPVSGAYVKVYARLADGSVRFFKDGYTDIRGRFAYASVSSTEELPVQRFALLILSDEWGTQVLEVAPPAR
ncbi:MAG: hypothetical protein U0935_22495 [Pirellulales bacterium]